MYAFEIIFFTSLFISQLSILTHFLKKIALKHNNDIRIFDPRRTVNPDVPKIRRADGKGMA